MKLRHPLMIKAIGFFAALLIRVWIGSLRFRFYSFGLDLAPTQPDLCRRYIYAFWHENLLLPACHFGRRDVWVLVSRHADGQVIAEAIRHLGFRVVSGSSTRGGVEAMRRMLELSKNAHVAITPDGPRGPRRRVQPGMIHLAARTGLPIVIGAFGYDRPWRMRS